MNGTTTFLSLRALLVCFVTLVADTTWVAAQDIGFPYGATNTRDLEMSVYSGDTSAAAVYLEEFGNAYVDPDNDHNLVFEYHARIKILKQTGLKVADYEIFLTRLAGRPEVLRTVKASSFSLEKGAIVETKLEYRNVFTEKHERYDLKKFALANVKVGSVIEVQYVLESPVFYHFRPWKFQSEYPKIKSEYKATIPGNYVYNVTLKGFLKLAENESTVVKGCFSIGAGKADCIRYRWVMTDVPAFVEEEFMTAPSNFIAAIDFELAEIRQFNGRVDKITSSWAEVQQALKRDAQFGVQLKKGKEILSDEVLEKFLKEDRKLERAKSIYRFIRDSYTWNGYYSKYSEDGIRKAFEKKSANIGDINLSLIAALRLANIQADPVILSTRDNGLPSSVHPVLSDFNYVIARIALKDTVYYLDASDDFYPFGMLPQRCFNGRARWLTEKKSEWVDLRPLQKGSRECEIWLKLGDNGIISGKVQTIYSGYEAVRMRKAFYASETDKQYCEDLQREFPEMKIQNLQMQGLDEIDVPLTQTFDLTVPMNAGPAGYFLLNPFLTRQWKKNPFSADTRLFPVDFATPIEHTTILHLDYPSDRFDITNLPQPQIFQLPGAAGEFQIQAVARENTITLENALLINKTVFSSAEYQSLKQLFTTMLEVQNSGLVIRRKF